MVKQNPNELDRFFSLCFIVIDYRFWYVKVDIVFLTWLMENDHFVFSTFKDSWFAVNQYLMFTCPLFTIVKRYFLSLWLKILWGAVFLGHFPAGQFSGGFFPGGVGDFQTPIDPPLNYAYLWNFLSLTVLVTFKL